MQNLQGGLPKKRWINLWEKKNQMKGHSILGDMVLFNAEFVPLGIQMANTPNIILTTVDPKCQDH